MNYVFAPGCALHIYNPELSHRIWRFLCDTVGDIELFLTCCHHDDNLPDGTTIINVCPGCNRRYKSRRAGLSTVSLWEVIANNPSFPFPNYDGMEMSVHDACPTRTETGMHAAIRSLLQQMNIRVIEPQYTMTQQKCCGDSYYPAHSVEEVNQRMKERTAQMPAEHVCVYCISCVKSIHIGGKTPRYLAELLFGELTVPGISETDKWHAEVKAFRDAH